ncbi:hypothetical protein CYLTODRAFT_424690 [Cylindrobasidium torrendii FP15055 ss-10]|uniref:Uncharacterized protein n=1 Tax=Cylindrobasidium torrendii FP15055 ss-10 TaxID=1314674 RepID=A0A0D7B499_9AGAR|nr:hypothetical protein CYLTODRAFT_424690 [Cylindrobasidium torrendii FP15055 ss-10]
MPPSDSSPPFPASSPQPFDVVHLGDDALPTSDWHIYHRAYTQAMNVHNPRTPSSESPCEPTDASCFVTVTTASPGNAELSSRPMLAASSPLGTSPPVSSRPAVTSSPQVLTDNIPSMSTRRMATNMPTLQRHISFGLAKPRFNASLGVGTPSCDELPVTPLDQIGSTVPHTPPAITQREKTPYHSHYPFGGELPSPSPTLAKGGNNASFESAGESVADLPRAINPQHIRRLCLLPRRLSYSQAQALASPVGTLKYKQLSMQPTNDALQSPMCLPSPVPVQSNQYFP